MKNDINLLYKRKTKTYSSKKLLSVVLLLVLLAAGMYAGIALPSGAIRVAKLESAELESRLSSSSQSQQELTERSQHETKLSLQHKELEKLSETRNGVSSYLEAIEKSIPSKASVTVLSLIDDKITINGIATDDDMIATFSLRLREQNAFKNVFIVSTLSIDDSCSFVIELTLPSTLSSEELIGAIEKKDDVTNATPEA